MQSSKKLKKDNVARVKPVLQDGFEKFLHYNEDKGRCDDIDLENPKSRKEYKDIKVVIDKFQPQAHSTLVEKNPLTNMSTQFKSKVSKRKLAQFLGKAEKKADIKPKIQSSQAGPSHLRDANIQIQSASEVGGIKRRKVESLTQPNQDGPSHQIKRNFLSQVDSKGKFKPLSTSSFLDEERSEGPKKNWMESLFVENDESKNEFEFLLNDSDSVGSFESYDSHTKGDIYKRAKDTDKDTDGIHNTSLSSEDFKFSSEVFKFSPEDLKLATEDLESSTEDLKLSPEPLEFSSQDLENTYDGCDGFEDIDIEKLIPPPLPDVDDFMQNLGLTINSNMSGSPLNFDEYKADDEEGDSFSFGF